MERDRVSKTSQNDKRQQRFFGNPQFYYDSHGLKDFFLNFKLCGSIIHFWSRKSESSFCSACFPELFYTERAHVRKLKVLDQVFYQRVSREGILPLSDLRKIFSNLEDILQLHGEQGHLAQRFTRLQNGINRQHRLCTNKNNQDSGFAHGIIQAEIAAKTLLGYQLSVLVF